ATTWSQTRRATGLRYTPFSNCECKGITIFSHTQNFKQVFYALYQQPPTFSFWHAICYLDFIVTNKKTTSILKL
ncbi:hypothetical protein, partial [Leyella stercorea]|uniref:hypothetical protein n=1 Tax=Leyella stercorea TaxID=363265 RepID=UPI003F7EB3D5